MYIYLAVGNGYTTAAEAATSDILIWIMSAKPGICCMHDEEHATKILNTNDSLSLSLCKYWHCPPQLVSQNVGFYMPVISIFNLQNMQLFVEERKKDREIADI